MWPYVVVLSAAAAAAAIVFAIVAARKAVARRKKTHSIEMVKISTVFRLERRYSREYDDPYFSRQLAQAVANEVFAGRPCGKAELKFVKYNAKAIQRRLRELRADTGLMRMLSLSAQVESGLREKRESRKDGSAQPLQQLEKLGLLDAGADVLDANEFERQAKDFCAANSAPDKVKN